MSEERRKIWAAVVSAGQDVERIETDLDAALEIHQMRMSALRAYDAAHSEEVEG